jgi:release factor glutamine methyltransferase
VLLKDFKIYFERELCDLFSLEEVRHFFYILIEDLLNENRFVLTFKPDYKLSAHDLSIFEQALNDLKKHRPIQYITGLAHFGDLTLKGKRIGAYSETRNIRTNSLYKSAV